MAADPPPAASIDSRTSLPVITADPVRVVVLYLIILLFGIGAYSAGSALGLWIPLQRLMGSDLLGSMLGLIASIVFTRIVLGYYVLMARRLVGSDTPTILRLIQRQDYQRALELTHKQERIFAEKPWLDKFRMLILLDGGAYGYHELALLNRAYIMLRQQRVDDVLAVYQEVLAVNPHNSIAADSLALAAAARGETPPQVSTPLPVGKLFDTGLTRRLRLIQLLFVPLVFLPCMVLFWWMFSLMYPLALAMAIGVAGGVVVASAAVTLYRFASQRIVLGDLIRGRRLARAGLFEEAAQAFEKQLAFLNDSPRVDQWRAWAMLDPTTFGYREMTLMELSGVYAHLGDGPSVEAVLRRALEINSANGNVWNALEFMRLAREQREVVEEGA